MKERVLHSIMVLVLVLGMALSMAVALPTPVGAATVTFTGNVTVDFNPALFPPGSILIIPDPGGLGDVILPAEAGGAISGWNMIDFRLSYNNVTDILYVGINTPSIAGDADGDGDPGHTAAWLVTNLGADIVNLGLTETIAVYFDLDKDGDYDVIAGVPGTTDISGFTCANYGISVYDFGTSLPTHTGSYYANPSAAAPNFEFTILGFSTLPGSDPSVGGFRVGVFMGSIEDNGVSEDFITYEQNPHTIATIVSSAPKVVSGQSVNLTVTEANPAGLYSMNITNPQVVVTQNGVPLPALGAPDSGDAAPFGVLNVNETWTWNNRPSNPITTTTTFVASGSGTAPGDFPVNYVTDPLEQDDVIVNAINPQLCIDKTVDCNDDGVYSKTETTTGPSDDADWKVVVWNCGDAPVFNVTVTDTNGHSFGAPFNLAVGANQTFTYTTTISATTTNTATAVGKDEVGGTVGPVSSSATNQIINPQLCINKTVDCNDDGVYSKTETTTGPSDDADWKVVVSNCGAAPVYNITVTDTNGHSFGAPFNLAVGANQTFTYTTTITTTTTNTATAVGKDATGATVGPVSSSATNRLVGRGCLQICKFEDANVNGMWDPGEEFLPDWRFHVTGYGYDEWVTTGADGCVVVSGLDSGTYTVTEELEAGWYNTRPGGDPPYEQEVTVETGTDCARVEFGNREEIKDVPPMIPTMNQWGIIAMIAVFAGLLVWTVRRKRLAS